jgi:5-(aminomethyl)-3-furanmethanol phosphate kinase
MVIAKVGGSLYDLPDLTARLRTWLAADGRPVLLVPGGGDGADVIRRLDRRHAIGEDAAHWLALRTLTVNAHFLSGLLRAPVRSDVQPAPSELAVLDPHAFCQADEGRPGALPHRWQVTSDSVAARAAEVAHADLVLLKSVDLPGDMTWRQAAAAGFVDEGFLPLVRRARVRVEWVNLRSPDWPAG